jgi:hypothetical protein
VSRLRQLLFAGLIDSFGLALGWTLFNIVAVRRGGLGEAALFNAAMLVGIVLAAPATTWASRRLSGRMLLHGVAGVEAALRAGTMAALLLDFPIPLVAAGVTLMYLTAYAGYAAMRAEVNLVDERPAAMTRYAMSVAAVEAGGAGVAALLPSTGLSVPIIIIVYALSLLPTFLSARRARVVPSPTPSDRPCLRRPDRQLLCVLVGGGLVALIASGPTLLSVALATELHGQTSVAAAAAAFSVGCLCSSTAVQVSARLRIPPTLAWPLWGAGMLAGWVSAPWHVAFLCGAQFLSGLSLTAFEGLMDSRAAGSTVAGSRSGARSGSVTTVLAWTAAARALGSAVAVRVLPVLVVAPSIGRMAGAGVALLVVSGVVLTVTVATLRPASKPGRGALAGTTRLPGRPAGSDSPARRDPSRI